ncbi:hypothetical protein JHK85_007111 [Glycine max]|nr:hypothetical protein JHK85_007111 [Glycine max]KAG5071704.1 hypothetical protein JHK86_006915 [Glycine max]
MVVFDTTNRINHYDMPLGLWVGVDNHENSIFFSCVLLQDEKICSFTWALKKEDRVKVATKEVERVIELVKGMAEVQEHSIELEHDVSNNNEYDVENPMISKAKG